MILKSVKITNYKNIIDSGDVDIDSTMTCVVGKNESGKTAFLEALSRINPISEDIVFNLQSDFPAWLLKKETQNAKLNEKKLGDETVISAKFVLTESDNADFVGIVGDGVLKSDEIGVSVDYDNYIFWHFEIDEKQALNNFVKNQIPESVAKQFEDCFSFSELRERIQNEAKVESVDYESIKEKIEKILGKNNKYKEYIETTLEKYLPDFYFVDEYSALPNSFCIEQILDAEFSDLGMNERTARTLLNMADFQKEHLQSSDFAEKKRELENVANFITGEVLKYWTTNDNLRVQIDIEKKETLDEETQENTEENIMYVRLYDNTRMISLPFNERSSGFQWFFSFLIRFNRLKDNKKSAVILLDEPGKGLHARAQKDFLKFIEEQLSEKNQIIYTTHSPFMINSNKLGQVRLIEDQGIEKGSIITSDVDNVDNDTSFPLKNVLDIEIE